MNRELFLQITTNAQIASALFLIAIALWFIVFKIIEPKRGSSK